VVWIMLGDGSGYASLYPCENTFRCVRTVCGAIRYTNLYGIFSLNFFFNVLPIIREAARVF
jgi:hypothetical protein